MYFGKLRFESQLHLERAQADAADMSGTSGDQLSRIGMRGILTMSPGEGGITELLCDMDECFLPTGRWDFEPIPVPMPRPIPEWIPSVDHFPKTEEVGGQRVAGNVRLAHRLCNRADFDPNRESTRGAACQGREEELAP